MNLDDIEKRALRGLELAQRIDRAGKLYQPPWTVGHPWSEDDGVVTVLVDGGSLFGDCCIGNMKDLDACHAADFIAASRVQWPQSCADVLELLTHIKRLKDIAAGFARGRDLATSRADDAEYRLKAEREKLMAVVVAAGSIASEEEAREKILCYNMGIAMIDALDALEEKP